LNFLIIYQGILSHDFIKIDFFNTLLTNQYAVTEHQTVLDPGHPQNFPGLFFKYEIEPISIRITASRRGVIQFITRMCGIVGGTYVTVGALLSFFRKIANVVKSTTSYSPVSKESE
jgi:hypothetical protein